MRLAPQLRIAFAREAVSDRRRLIRVNVCRRKDVEGKRGVRRILERMRQAGFPLATLLLLLNTFILSGVAGYAWLGPRTVRWDMSVETRRDTVTD